MARIPRGLFVVVKEVLRHLLRRPVVGVAAAARTRDGRWLLIRRGDTGQWALPGGTLEWGETLRTALPREILEEAGARVIELGAVSGVYSDPAHDERFHAVTVVVHALVEAPDRPPLSAVEIREVRLFADHELPVELAHGMSRMLQNARSGAFTWE